MVKIAKAWEKLEEAAKTCPTVAKILEAAQTGALFRCDCELFIVHFCGIVLCCGQYVSLRT
jgi:hypothetical protein